MNTIGYITVKLLLAVWSVVVLGVIFLWMWGTYQDAAHPPRQTYTAESEHAPADIGKDVYCGWGC